MITLYRSLNSLNLSVGDCFLTFEVIQIDSDKILLRDILTEKIDYYSPDSLNCFTDPDNTSLKSLSAAHIKDPWELEKELKRFNIFKQRKDNKTKNPL